VAKLDLGGSVTVDCPACGIPLTILWDPKEGVIERISRAIYRGQPVGITSDDLAVEMTWALEHVREHEGATSGEH
jgi:hypothetical protein